MLPLLLDRERSSYPTQKFFSRLGSADVGLISKLRHREETLEGHRGCVNTVSFTQDGSWLLSGSDDQQIIVWDWNAGALSSHMSSGEQLGSSSPDACGNQIRKLWQLLSILGHDSASVASEQSLGWLKHAQD